MDAGEWVPAIGLGDRLRIVRRRKHRSQEEMAALLGVKKVTYASWEAGIGTPPYDVVLKIARRLYMLDRVPQWWTLGADDPALSSRSVYDYGSEGWEFESLRARPLRRRGYRHRRQSVVPLYLVGDPVVIPA